MLIRLKNGIEIETTAEEEVDKVIKIFNGQTRLPEWTTFYKGKKCEKCGGKLGKFGRKFCRKCRKERARERARINAGKRGKSVRHEQRLKNCKLCGNEFSPSGNQKYCSKGCKTEQLRKVARDFYWANKKRISVRKKEQYKVEVQKG